MNKFSSCSDISLDSLENDFQKKSSLKETARDDVETILVPFYEKDVLIEVPKVKKEKKNNQSNRQIKNSKSKKDTEPKSYLMNRNSQANKKSSYLDVFRKQFVSSSICKKKETEEIRSTSPQVGDTEVGSIYEGENNNESGFFNTEAYNEIYYEKLINQDMEYYLDQSLEALQFSQELENKTQNELDNLKSVSEVSHTRQHKRRATAQPMHTMKLGGLGPDMDNIRPRLERARSLQRYSEKVRMENRLKIYKKSVEEESKKNFERQTSAKKSDSSRDKLINTDEQKNTYLMNKIMKEKSSIIKRIYHSKSKSADVQNQKPRRKQVNNQNCSGKNNIGSSPRKSRTARSNLPLKDAPKVNNNDNKHSNRKSSGRDQGINTDSQKQYTETKVQPMEISFHVNIGTGLRPSSALRNLEEKHKHFQEKVKAFTTDFRNE